MKLDDYKNKLIIENNDYQKIEIPLFKRKDYNNYIIEKIFDKNDDLNREIYKLKRKNELLRNQIKNIKSDFEKLRVEHGKEI